MENTVKLYSLSLRQTRATLLALAFVAGNILLPQLCHAIPQGGKILLPIFFFTLVAAYKYGWQVGLLTAVLSPVINHLCFGMPSATVLPTLLAKSVALAVVASAVARRYDKVTLPLMALVVVGYQLIGGAVEAILTSSLTAPMQDFSLGAPGLVLQVVGGYLVLRYLLKS